MSNLEQLLRELRCNIKKDSEESLKIVEERITKRINENVDKKFEDIHWQIELIKKNNNEQNERILTIEKQIRCRNLIFFGVEEGEKYYEDLENKIIHIVTIDMKVECNRSEIELTKRMGKKTENKIRPIVVSFSTYGKKLSILRNKQQLKNNPIYIKEDYPQQVLQKRKQLQDQLQQARNEGKVAYLRQDRLIVNETNKTQLNEESANNYANSRKRELEITPPSQLTNPNGPRSQSLATPQIAKKNKHKTHIPKNGQSSMSSFLQKCIGENQKPFTPATTTKEADD